MARAHFQDVAIDPSGNWVPGATITVRSRGQSTLANIYAAETDIGAMANPYTTPDGIISHWADAGAYDVYVQDTNFPKKFQDRIVGWGAVPGVQGGIPANMIQAKGITEAQIADLAITNPLLAGSSVDVNKIADGSVSNPKLAASAVDYSKTAVGTFDKLLAFGNSSVSASIGNNTSYVLTPVVSFVARTTSVVAETDFLVRTGGEAVTYNLNTGIVWNTVTLATGAGAALPNVVTVNDNTFDGSNATSNHPMGGIGTISGLTPGTTYYVAPYFQVGNIPVSILVRGMTKVKVYG